MNTIDIAKIVRTAGKQAVVTVLATMRQKTDNLKVAEAEAEALLHATPEWQEYDIARAERLRVAKATSETEAAVREVAKDWAADSLPDGITQRKAPPVVTIDRSAFLEWLQLPGNFEVATDNELFVIDTARVGKFAEAVKVKWATVAVGTEARIASKLPGAVEGDGPILTVTKKGAYFSHAVTTRGINVQF